MDPGRVGRAYPEMQGPSKRATSPQPDRHHDVLLLLLLLVVVVLLVVLLQVAVLLLLMLILLLLMLQLVMLMLLMLLHCLLLLPGDQVARSRRLAENSPTLHGWRRFASIVSPVDRAVLQSPHSASP
jgi:hypothetical protein